MMDDDKEKQVSQRSQERNPYTPWFVVIAFVAPVVIAYGLYFFEVTPPSYSNYGELITPVIDINDLELSRSGKLVDREEVTQGKWNMVFFSKSSCDVDCNTVLHNMRQINIAAGKNAHRVQRLIVHLENADLNFDELIQKEYPDAFRLEGNRDLIDAVFERNSIRRDANEIYILDPLGNIMMRFRNDQGPKEILHDLKRLLKASRIG